MGDSLSYLDNLLTLLMFKLNLLRLALVAPLVDLCQFQVKSSFSREKDNFCVIGACSYTTKGFFLKLSSIAK